MSTPKKIIDKGLLSLLHESKIPFAIVKSNDLFGDLTFITIAWENKKAVARYTRNYVGRWHSCPFDPLFLGVAELESLDRNYFRELRENDELIAISLGKNGTAYELKDSSFKAHYESVCRNSFISPKVFVYRSHHKKKPEEKQQFLSKFHQMSKAVDTAKQAGT